MVVSLEILGHNPEKRIFEVGVEDLSIQRRQAFPIAGLKVRALSHYIAVLP
jgi:hypothetical protein